MKKSNSRVKHICKTCNKPINKGRASFIDSKKQPSGEYLTDYYHWYCRPKTV